ncbi:hypothetical protein [Bacillus sp. V59.32b]|uniref:hypothetical protein n=1 Tax=Bacillus sp. V59.32b TaxID=1758642 RepID=UPI000E3DC056|nr:hypothetical protein [Bacillus sp. V59.32b]RFU60619.1 hypothetical protein D0463_16600 [Bacillus sp. V59.32b]
MAKSKNSLLGLAVLGTAAYLFRNKESRNKVVNKLQSVVTPETRDKVMNKLQSVVTPETREKIKDQVRTFTGGNGSQGTQTPQSKDEAEPNSQALTTAETMNQQTEKFLEPEEKKEVTELNVTK